ncbi:response regulator [Desulfogranum mediterraneum]|uniref:response regulator n=1 Tax=Desulfogranum mediterraneum TaxID=160661 RepID=UPI0003F8EC1B|nr:response regulator [Desulfogranum mediterraneum]
MTKRNVLFVDDEPNILSGLRRMLRSMRKEMEFHFAESGKEALEVFAASPIDIIVSDMRMPGMDGATLLTTVQEEYPQTIRIMLTGQADEESILRTVGVVHQFLAKPSDPETLREVLQRACALQELMNNDGLKSLVSSLGSLPSLPAVYRELQSALHNPECTIADVSAIIEKDIAMSAKVLQLVNSAFFGLYKNIDSPSRAVNLLGLDTVKALVLGVGVFTELKPPSSKNFSLASLWEHSFTTASFAKKIAQLESNDKELIDQTFIAGIIHDIGKLLLFSSLKEQYVEAVDRAAEENLSLSEAEIAQFNADHSDVGSYLIGLWGLPGQVVEAIAFQHRLEQYPEPSFCPALILHAADIIYYSLKPEECIGRAPVINQAYLEQIGMDDHYQAWFEQCRELLQ